LPLSTWKYAKAKHHCGSHCGRWSPVQIAGVIAVPQCLELNGSIKRDVKKKLLPRPEERGFLEIQPAVIRLRWRSLSCTHSDQCPLVSSWCPPSLREQQANGDLKVNHGSIRGSWPIAISGYPRGH